MDKTLYIILWVLVGLVIVSSFSTGWFFIAKQNLYEEYVKLENIFTTSVERLNSELTSSNKENMRLKAKLESIEKDMRTLESKNINWESKYKKFLKERDDLNKELARAKKEKGSVIKQLEEMKSDGFLSKLLREKIALELELGKFRNSMEPQDLEIEKFKKDAKEIGTKLSQITEERDLLQKRLEDSIKVAEILSRDLLKEKDMTNRWGFDMSSSSSDSFLESNDMFDDLAKKNEAMQLKIFNLERDLEYKEREIDKLRVALGDRKENTNELRPEAYHTQAEVDLPPIILERKNYGKTNNISPLEHITGYSALKGRVVTVNREHNFAVIDLGSQNGITVGTQLKLYRGDLLIGFLKVIQVRERISAADIVDVEENFRAEIDDAVLK